MTTYTNPNPYEYLGCDVSDLDDLDEMLAAGGADFDVALQPVTTSVPDLDSASGALRIEATDYRSVVRLDTNEVFAIHKKGYTGVQYREVLASALDALDAAGSTAKVQSCGTIDGGRQFYASIMVDRQVLDPNGVNDIIDTYLNLVASHNGPLGICYAFGNFRMVCSNQSPSLLGQQFVVKAKHTRSVKDRIGLGLRALGLATDANAAFAKQAMLLQAKPSSTGDVLKTIERLYGKPSDLPDGVARTRSENKRDRILSLYKGDTCVGAVGHTKWAEYNAFTEYLDHGRLIGGSDPVGKMAKTTILPGTWVEKEKVKIGELLLAG